MAAVWDEIQRVFRLQSEHKWAAKTSSLYERQDKLSSLRSGIIARADDIQAALSADLAKPGRSPYAPEIESMLTAIDDAVAHLAEWSRPLAVEPSPNLAQTAPTVEYEARGVCLIFGPWNLPFQLLLEPLVPALAAGNTAILHPNELTPQTAKITAEIIRAVFDEQHVAIFEGDVDVAKKLLQLPVDHIFFTGSPRVGKIVMAAAAKNLATVTLELGGKCPVIIDGTHDAVESASLVAVGRHSNAGQLCLATDHAWVKRDHLPEFLDHYNTWIDDNLYQDGELDGTAMSHIVDEPNLNRILSYIDDARARGGRIVRGGHRATKVADMIEPTIILDPPLEAQVMTEEIFGPVLPVQTFDDTNEILDYLRSRPKPLAMYIFSDDPAFVDTLIANTSSGGVTVNGFATHIAESRLPFGGVNHSGSGRYHGIHGFHEFSNQRAIVRHLPAPTSPPDDKMPVTA